MIAFRTQWRSYGDAVRPWRYFYGGGTMDYAVSCKSVQAVLK